MSLSLLTGYKAPDPFQDAVISAAGRTLPRPWQVCVPARVMEELATGPWAFAVHGICLREKQVEEKV